MADLFRSERFRFVEGKGGRPHWTDESLHSCKNGGVGGGDAVTGEREDGRDALQCV